MSKIKTAHISDLNIPTDVKVNLKEFEQHESSLNLRDPTQVRDMLLQHFMFGEHDTFFEILALYVDYVGKTRISREAKIPERTVYNFLRGDHKTSSENVFKVMKFISSQIAS